jgi:hypothetical protein
MMEIALFPTPVGTPELVEMAKSGKQAGGVTVLGGLVVCAAWPGKDNGEEHPGGCGHSAGWTEAFRIFGRQIHGLGCFRQC